MDACAHCPRWIFALLLALFSTAAAAHASISPQQWRADVAAIRSGIAQTHPDVGFSVDPQQLDRKLDELATSVRSPIDRDQAWRRLATLNPLLADAHFCVCFDDWRAEAAALASRGGGLFPFEVQVDDSGQIVVRATVAGRATPLAGARIVAIDGRPARRIAADLLARMHGDTPAFRAALLSRRFGFYFWKMYGQRAQFDVDIDIERAGRQRLRVAAARPASAPRFDDEFGLTLLPGNTAVLRVNTFAWPEKQQVLDFTAASFRRLGQAAVHTLIIDIRANGGGNDDQWLDGLMPYLADKPFRFASGYRKKIIEKYRDAGETPGAVVDGPIDRWIAPQSGDPLFFRGQTYVLVGRGTYSSAILFSNVLQDFAFATIAGSGGLARAQQSGGVQNLALAHTGLVLAVPRFILRRPSGALAPALLTPDLPLADDPLRPQAVIDALLQTIEAQP
ncbi:C-terminal processing protease CtpA/Prc [Tahibacter aquaticus]|uniref:C-terminal processing protease CtpA/Prc n=1 Tax=Tahibacter aquaticus TaxID=520092 RepID=A0A4R6Z782_9GAMM|nr:S41 family peptidase [Tahibacter aquaticus]TDR47637.1 C-terminal processing protease CtpA/Prc [Tahibacter aquaticus]